jgi:hypothetical protein
LYVLIPAAETEAEAVKLEKFIQLEIIGEELSYCQVATVLKDGTNVPSHLSL